MSMRKCDFCKEHGLSISRFVDVNPHYSYNIRSVRSPVDFHDILYIDIEEKFICPYCGRVNVKTYDFTPDQEALKYFVDKIIEGAD